MITSERLELIEEWSTESQGDRESGLVRDILLCGLESKNGYKILTEAFGDNDRVKELYEGRLVFLNHAKGNHRTRDIDDAAGVIRNVRLVNGRPRGDIEAYVNTERGRTLFALATTNPPPKGCGLSHTARYRWNDRLDTVVRVEEVLSVDLVTGPATTNTFREQTGEMTLEALQKELDTVRTERDGYKRQLDEATAKLAAVNAEFSAFKTEQAKISTEAAGYQSELAALRKKVDEYELREALASRRESVLKSLKDAGLNPEDSVAVSPVFLEHLLTIEDADVRTEAIKDRVALIDSVKTSKPTSAARQTPKPSAPFDPKTIQVSFDR